MTPRYFVALARPGAVEVGAATPEARAIVISGACVAVLCAWSSLPQLLQLASVAVLAQYGLTAIALVVLARRRAEGLVPRDAWPAPFALVVVAMLLAQARTRELVLAAVVALGGMIVARAVER